MLISKSHIQEMLDSTNRMLESASVTHSAIYASALAEASNPAVRNALNNELPTLIEELQMQKRFLSSILSRDDGESIPDDLIQIETLGLSNAEVNLLKRHNILFVSSLSSYLQYHSLTQLRGCGQRMADKITGALEKYEKKKEKEKSSDRDLISVQGNLYSYISYDEKTHLHKVAEVEIDEEGHLTCTYRSCFFTEEELKETSIDLTEKQWIGLVEHIIKDVIDCDDKMAEEAAEDIICRCFKTKIPTVEELPSYIAGYFCRQKQ